jgi:carbon monoxide dehydrogenase subunit G
VIGSPLEELWEVIRDPHHLPRWWPRVTRIEDVEDDAFTEVMRTAKGKLVRADFKLVKAEEETRELRWEQQLEGTPFARLLKSAETEVRLVPVAAVTEVTIELHQTLNGFVPRLGSYLVRRAARATLEEALDGLERLSG